MSRRSSALVFAVLWTGAMPWTPFPADVGAVALMAPIALMALGVLAGLVCYWLTGAPRLQRRLGPHR